jgi:hypothetical protein
MKTRYSSPKVTVTTCLLQCMNICFYLFLSFT